MKTKSICDLKPTDVVRMFDEETNTEEFVEVSEVTFSNNKTKVLVHGLQPSLCFYIESNYQVEVVSEWSKEFPSEAGYYWFYGTVLKTYAWQTEVPILVFIDEFNEKWEIEMIGTEQIYRKENFKGMFKKIMFPKVPNEDME